MNITKTSLILTLFAAPVTSQSLEMNAFIEPAVGAAFYDLGVYGSPLGSAFCFASLRQSDPILFPSIQGALLIDPAFAVPLGAVPLDPFGYGQLMVQVPMPVANGLVLFAQTVVLDVAPQIAFTNFACSVCATFNLPIAFGIAIGSHYSLGVYKLVVEDGPPGGVAELVVNGGQKAIGVLYLDNEGDGTTTVPIPGGMVRGDTVAIRINGVVVKQWTH